MSSDESVPGMPSYSHHSAVWQNPQTNDDECESSEEPELQSDAILTRIHADVFGMGMEAVLESMQQVQLSPRSMMRRSQSSPVPLNALGMKFRFGNVMRL